jgi:hypothetical protein
MRVDTIFMADCKAPNMGSLELCPAARRAKSLFASSVDQKDVTIVQRPLRAGAKTLEAPEIQISAMILQSFTACVLPILPSR